MNRYLIKFSKTGYMRFISHLDLCRLFRRCCKMAGFPVAYSLGFNPHELINVVHPLSLGFETYGDYIEIDTSVPVDTEEYIKKFNSIFPAGISFISAEEVPYGKKNMTSLTRYAEYIAITELDKSIDLHIDGFLSQNEILINKRDKKTKTYIEKDAKAQILSLNEDSDESGVITLRMILNCAVNDQLNPSNLIAALYKYNGLDYSNENVLIRRIDMFTLSGSELRSASHGY